MTDVRSSNPESPEVDTASTTDNEEFTADRDRLAARRRNRRHRGRLRDPYLDGYAVEAEGRRLAGDNLDTAVERERVERLLAGPPYRLAIEGQIDVAPGDAAFRARVDRVCVELCELGFHPQRYLNVAPGDAAGRRRWTARRVGIDEVELAIERNPGLTLIELRDLLFRDDPWTPPARANAATKLRLALNRLRRDGRPPRIRFDGAGVARVWPRSDAAPVPIGAAGARRVIAAYLEVVLGPGPAGPAALRDAIAEALRRAAAFARDERDVPPLTPLPVPPALRCARLGDPVDDPADDPADSTE